MRQWLTALVLKRYYKGITKCLYYEATVQQARGNMQQSDKMIKETATGNSKQATVPLVNTISSNLY